MLDFLNHEYTMNMNTFTNEKSSFMGKHKISQKVGFQLQSSIEHNLWHAFFLCSTT